MKNPKIDLIEYAHEPGEIQVLLDGELFSVYQIREGLNGVQMCKRLNMESDVKNDIMVAIAFDAGMQFQLDEML